MSNPLIDIDPYLNPNKLTDYYEELILKVSTREETNIEASITRLREMVLLYGIPPEREVSFFFKI